MAEKVNKIYTYFSQFGYSQEIKMHVTVMLAEPCRICCLNYETEHQLRDKTINCNVIEVLCARCHHR